MTIFNKEVFSSFSKNRERRHLFCPAKSDAMLEVQPTIIALGTSDLSTPPKGPRRGGRDSLCLVRNEIEALVSGSRWQFVSLGDCMAVCCIVGMNVTRSTDWEMKGTERLASSILHSLLVSRAS